jgi:hypothetical protein
LDEEGFWVQLRMEERPTTKLKKKSCMFSME